MARRRPSLVQSKKEKVKRWWGVESTRFYAPHAFDAPRHCYASSVIHAIASSEKLSEIFEPPFSMHLRLQEFEVTDLWIPRLAYIFGVTIVAARSRLPRNDNEQIKVLMDEFKKSPVSKRNMPPNTFFDMGFNKQPAQFYNFMMSLFHHALTYYHELCRDPFETHVVDFLYPWERQDYQFRSSRLSDAACITLMFDAMRCPRSHYRNGDATAIKIIWSLGAIVTKDISHEDDYSELKQIIADSAQRIDYEVDKPFPVEDPCPCKRFVELPRALVLPIFRGFGFEPNICEMRVPLRDLKLQGRYNLHIYRLSAVVKTKENYLTYVRVSEFVSGSESRLEWFALSDSKVFDADDIMEKPYTISKRSCMYVFDETGWG